MRGWETGKNIDNTEDGYGSWVLPPRTPGRQVGKIGFGQWPLMWMLAPETPQPISSYNHTVCLILSRDLLVFSVGSANIGRRGWANILGRFVRTATTEKSAEHLVRLFPSSCCVASETSSEKWTPARWSYREALPGQIKILRFETRPAFDNFILFSAPSSFCTLQMKIRKKVLNVETTLGRLFCLRIISSSLGIILSCEDWENSVRTAARDLENSTAVQRLCWGNLCGEYRGFAFHWLEEEMAARISCNWLRRGRGDSSVVGYFSLFIIFSCAATLYTILCVNF